MIESITNRFVRIVILILNCGRSLTCMLCILSFKSCKHSCKIFNIYSSTSMLSKCRCSYSNSCFVLISLNVLSISQIFMTALLTSESIKLRFLLSSSSLFESSSFLIDAFNPHFYLIVSKFILK
jgi:uncharacterized membrane protein